MMATKKGHNSWSGSFPLFNVILFNPFIFVSLIYAAEMGGYVLFMPDAHFYERAHISAKRRYKWPPSIATVRKHYFIFYRDPLYQIQMAHKIGPKIVFNICKTRKEVEKGSDFPSTLVICEKLDFFEIASKLWEKVLLDIHPSQLGMPFISVFSEYENKSADIFALSDYK